MKNPNSKQKALNKIRIKNKLELEKGKQRIEDFKKSIGVEVGNMITCTNSFKAPMLPGGFTKGRKYKVIGFCSNEVSILDDELNVNDPMTLNINMFNKYFN